MSMKHPNQAPAVFQKSDSFELADCDETGQIIKLLSSLPDPTYDIVVVADDVAYDVEYFGENNGTKCNYTTGEIRLSKAFLDGIGCEHKFITAITIEYVTTPLYMFTYGGYFGPGNDRYIKQQMKHLNDLAQGAEEQQEHHLHGVLRWAHYAIGWLLEQQNQRHK